MRSLSTRDSSDSGVKYFSGSARCAAQFTLPVGTDGSTDDRRERYQDFQTRVWAIVEFPNIAIMHIVHEETRSRSEQRRLEVKPPV